jgi:putative ABC transport system substrate-binding protein
MKRRFFVSALGVTLAMALGATPVGAQPRKAAPRVAYVYIYKEGPSAPFVKAFRERMSELGWVDGKNISIEVRDAEGNPDKLAAIMRELVDSKIDVIVAACTPEAKAATKFTSTIPIVMAATGDPVAAGLVASLARPGGNVTGVSAMLLDLSAKRLAILKEAFPKVTHATVLWNPGRPDNLPEVKAMEDAAKALGIRLDSQQVRSPAEMADVLELLPTTGTGAILNAGDTLLSNQTPALVAFAAKHRLPALYESRGFVDEGGLMSFGPNFPQLHRAAAEYVNKILKGAKPGDLPIQRPTKFELVVNLRTANALGFSIPQPVLLRADDVIR